MSSKLTRNTHVPSCHISNSFITTCSFFYTAPLIHFINFYHPLPQGFAHHSIALAALILNVVEMDDTSLVDEVKHHDSALRSAEDGHMEGDTAVMLTVAAQPS